MTKFSDLKNGSILSEFQSYRVNKIVGEKVQLTNERGENIVVDKNYVESCLSSADQFSSTKTINRTEASNLIISNPGIVMEVIFQKQIKETDVIKEIMTAYEGSTPKAMENVIKKAVKRGLEGDTRVMRGYHKGETDGFGRIHFVDMEITSGHNMRLVDPRTISQIIVKNIKYIIK